MKIYEVARIIVKNPENPVAKMVAAWAKNKGGAE